MQCDDSANEVSFIRERERELFGPKKRGPKPETFLLKVGKYFDAYFWDDHMFINRFI